MRSWTRQSTHLRDHLMEYIMEISHATRACSLKSPMCPLIYRARPMITKKTNRCHTLMLSMLSSCRSRKLILKSRSDRKIWWILRRIEQREMARVMRAWASWLQRYPRLKRLKARKMEALKLKARNQMHIGGIFRKRLINWSISKQISKSLMNMKWLPSKLLCLLQSIQIRKSWPFLIWMRL